MDKMFALYFEEHGGLDKIKYGFQPIPEIGPHEVLIKTEYAGLNHLDLFVLHGWPGLKLDIPHIMGSDGSGYVHKVGNLVTSIKPGDRVTINPGIGCGICNACLSGAQNFCQNFAIKGENISGTFAEFFKIPASNILKVPNEIPLDIAAAAPLNFLTAWRMMVSLGKVKPGMKVFIQGAGGGVATACIQIAKLWNAQVITTTSTLAKMEKAQNIGADFVLNYKNNPEYSKDVYKDITQKQGVDLAIDSVGKATFSTTIRLLKTGGKLVTCGATTGGKVNIDINSIFWKHLQIIGSTMSNHHEFQEVMSHVFDGRLTPVIDHVFPLEEGKEAEKYLQQGQQFGKVLLKVYKKK